MQKASTYLIKGGWSAHGEVDISGDTNSAIANTCHAILAGGVKTISNVPRTDIFLRFLSDLRLLGVEAEWVSVKQIKIDLNWNIFNPDFVENYAELSPAFLEVLINIVLAKRLSVRVPLKYRTHLQRYKRLGCIIEYSDDNYFLIQAPNTDDSESPVLHIHSYEKDFYALLNYALLKNIYPKIHIDFENKHNPVRIFTDTTYVAKNKYFVTPNVAEINFYAILSVLTDGELDLNGVDLSLSLGFLMDLDEIGASYEVKKNKVKIWQDLKLMEDKYNYVSSNADELGYLVLFHTLFREQSVKIVCRDSFDIRALIKTINIMGCHVGYIELEDKLLELTVKPGTLSSFKLAIPNSRWGGVILAAAFAYEGNTIISDMNKISEYMPFLDESLQYLDLKITARS